MGLFGEINCVVAVALANFQGNILRKLKFLGGHHQPNVFGEVEGSETHQLCTMRLVAVCNVFGRQLLEK